MLFCYVCGLFKVAVIAQQIYARYARGMTKDSRFAVFNRLVAALGLGAVRDRHRVVLIGHSKKGPHEPSQ